MSSKITVSWTCDFCGITQTFATEEDEGGYGGAPGYYEGELFHKKKGWKQETKKTGYGFLHQCPSCAKEM